MDPNSVERYAVSGEEWFDEITDSGGDDREIDVLGLDAIEKCPESGTRLEIVGILCDLIDEIFG